MVATKSLFSSLSTRRALGGHRMLFFFIVNKNGTWRPSSAFFFSLSIRKAPNGHQMPFFALCGPGRHIMATKCFFYLIIDKNDT